MSADGCIHGRFQVFHHDHLDYLLRALQHCESRIVRITSVTGLRGKTSDPHRHSATHNPFRNLELRGLLERIRTC